MQVYPAVEIDEHIARRFDLVGSRIVLLADDDRIGLGEELIVALADLYPNDMLIRKLEYHHTTDEGDSHPEEIYWSDHRTVAGITFAHKWTRYWSNGKVMEEYTYSNVDFGRQLAEHFFDRPEDHMFAVEGK